MDTPISVPARPPSAGPRLDWLDNLRVALMVLVVAHHAAQAYGPADWWYVEDQPRSQVLATFSAFNGTFFMSLFFFVSAYFVPDSYDRHGPWAFLRGRLKRLGIPLVVGALTIVPGLMYAYYVHYRGYAPISFPRYFTDIYLGLGEEPADWSGPSWPDLQFGHLWFVQNLLAYCLLYAACRQAARFVRRRPAAVRETPGHIALLALTLVLTAATFLIRIAYPLDTWVPFLDFLQVEPARLPQYAAFFTLGVLARRRDWLHRIPARTGWIWLQTGAAGTVLLFAVGADAPCFGPGGFNAPSLLWSLYENLLCTALSIGLLVLFRETWNGGNRFSRSMAADAFTVYVLHLPVVVALQYALAGHGLAAATAFTLVAVAATLLTFPLAALVRRLPGFRAVL